MTTPTRIAIGSILIASAAPNSNSAAPADSPWNPTEGARASHRPIVTDEALEQAGYGELWTTSLPIANDPVLGVHLLDENLYVLTRFGDVFALQADTGLLRWAAHLDDRLFRDRTPTHVQRPGNDGPFVLVSHAAASVLDRYTGDTLLRLDLPFPAASAAAVNATNLFVGGADGRFYALRWSTDPRCASLVRWRAQVKGTVTQPPVLALGRLYLVSDGGVVYCLAQHANSLIWAYDVGSKVSGGIHVDPSGVYVAALDHVLSVLDTDTGRRIHAYHLPDVLPDTPTVVQRTLYQRCAGDGLYAFDVDTRARLWQLPRARRFVAKAAENLVLTDDAGDLLLVDNRDGRVRSTIPLPPNTVAVTNERDAVLYLVTPDGRVLCAKPSGFPYLRREAVMTARAHLRQRPTEIGTSRAADTPIGTNAPSAIGDDRRDPLRSRSPG